MFTKLSQREEYIASQIVDLAYVRQREVPIHYESLLIEDGLRLDLLVDNLVIIELKAQENFHPVWEAQLLSYLRLTNKRFGAQRSTKVHDKPIS